ncbi:MAG TPA: ATP-binding protein, partial [Bacteroidia bacterium]|nr:ATP-binding protein [Bacteroidia bacterium]
MKQESSTRLLYNPSRIPQEEFLRGFIVRQAEFQRIWEDMRDARLDAMDPHFLITGQRGMGKTSLMLKVAYEIRRDSRLSDWLLPVLLPEEMYGVSDLMGFWVAVAKAVEAQNPGKFKGLGEEAEAAAMKDDETKVMETIVDRLRKPQSKLVIFIDNFGDLLDRLPEKEIHRLREIFTTAKWLRVVAASARVLDHTYSYDKPFFDFFHPIALRGLSKDEAKGLLEGLAELEPEDRREEILKTL